MFRKVLILSFLALICVSALAQDEPPVVALSVNAGGAFTTNNGNQHSPNIAGQVSFENYFNKRSGVAINYAFLPSQRFATNLAMVQANGHEFTGAYIARFPRRKITPFLMGGGGVMIYDPSMRFVVYSATTPSAQARFALLYGGGLDYSIKHHIAFRMQYRGLFFPTPSFATPDMANSGHSHIIEPMIGIVFRF